MLESLRKHSKSWMTKLIFGTIALAFVLYFGFSFNAGPPGGPAAPVAKVNGEAIPFGAFSQLVQGQTAMLEQFNPGKVSPDTIKVVETQVLQGLIGKVLLAQEAHRLGLRVTDIELANEIRGNPTFQKDGSFSESFYLDQFKPYYERQNGEDYEEVLRKDLLVDKLRMALESAAVFSQNQVKTLGKLTETQLNLRQLTVPLSTEAGKNSREVAMEIAKEWIASGKTPETQPDAKTPPHKVEEIGMKPLAQLQLALGREDSLPVLECLLQLTPGKKCETPFLVGKSVVAVELIERKNPVPVSETEAALAQQLAQGRKNQILSAVQDMLTAEAKIETFLQK